MRKSLKVFLKDKKNIYKIIAVLVPFLILPLFAFKGFILDLMHRLPVCPFYKSFHLYCPGCGNTRSIIAFLHGDFYSSLRFNIVPILIFLLLLGIYIEFTSYSFGHHIRILPRKDSFYIVFALLLAMYFVIRNFFPYLTP